MRLTSIPVLVVSLMGRDSMRTESSLNLSLGQSKTPLVSQGGSALVFVELLVDLGNGTGTNGAATLTDREA